MVRFAGCVLLTCRPLIYSCAVRYRDRTSAKRSLRSYKPEVGLRKRCCAWGCVNGVKIICSFLQIICSFFGTGKSCLTCRQPLWRLGSRISGSGEHEVISGAFLTKIRCETGAHLMQSEAYLLPLMTLSFPAAVLPGVAHSALPVRRRQYWSSGSCPQKVCMRRAAFALSAS